MNIRILAAVALATSLMVTAAHAPSGQKLQANIPFEFRVGQKLFPPGTYTVRALSQGVVLVRSLDWKEAGMVQTYGVRANQAPSKGKLVFRRYGNNTFFLFSVWRSGEDRGYQLQKSTAERELAQRRQTPTLASIPASMR